MNISSSWGSSKTSRKGRRTVTKTKIRWDVLGLQDPARGNPATSIEEIRRQVTSMASHGLDPGTRSRSALSSRPNHSAPKASAPIKKAPRRTAK
ncbi:hypothetical protein [Petrachloros mirabilis]